MTKRITVLELLNELGGVGANFVAVKDMKAPQAIHGLAGKARKRDWNELLAEVPGEPTPTRRRANRGDKRDMRLPRMQQRAGQEPLLQAAHHQAPVCPDIGDRARWEQEHRPAIERLPNSGPDQALPKWCREERERGFCLVFRKPRGLPGILVGVGRRFD